MGRAEVWGRDSIVSVVLMVTWPSERSPTMMRSHVNVPTLVFSQWKGILGWTSSITSHKEFMTQERSRVYTAQIQYTIMQGQFLVLEDREIISSIKFKLCFSVGTVRGRLKYNLWIVTLRLNRDNTWCHNLLSGIIFSMTNSSQKKNPFYSRMWIVLLLYPERWILLWKIRVATRTGIRMLDHEYTGFRHDAINEVGRFTGIVKLVKVPRTLSIAPTGEIMNKWMKP